MRNLYYFAYAVSPDEEKNYTYFPSSLPKIRYIIRKIKDNGYNLRVISTCQAKQGWQNRKKEIIDEKLQVRYLASCAPKNPFLRKLSIFLILLQITLELVFRVKKHDAVLIYHSMSYYYPLLIAGKLKKLNLIIDVEEKYADIYRSITDDNKIIQRIKKREDFILSLANRYFFASDLLKETINKENKKDLVLYGTYEVITDFPDLEKQENHLLYSGTFGLDKGVHTAVRIANYLDNNYTIHISGFGSKNEIDRLKKTIKEVSAERHCTIIYHGFMDYEDYLKLAAQCDIGLCTQSSVAEYQDSIFPSKIISYMSCGLQCVSVAMKVLDKSTFSEFIIQYHVDDLQEIAATIMNAKRYSRQQIRDVVKQMDRQFTEDLHYVFGD